MSIEPERLEALQRDLCESRRMNGRWPWPSIPPAYRKIGKPDGEWLAKTKDALVEDSVRPRLVTFLGSVGTGKTTAACQLASWVACVYGVATMGTRWDVAEGSPEVILYPTKAHYTLALAMGWMDADYREFLAEVDILVLDDLSAGLTPAGLAHSLEIIETRIGWQRRTILTTSMRPDEISAAEIAAHGREIGIASRILGGVVIDLGEKDLRLTPK